MKIAYFPNQTALQSEPVWRAFLEGMKKLGHTPVENDPNADAAVIWSVLWSGRMRANQQVFEHYRSQNKPVFIIEVGALNRGNSWKISLNNITSDGIYANKDDFLKDRDRILQVNLAADQFTRSKSILIVGQHKDSLQWQGQPPLDTWIKQTIQKVRQFTDRSIIIRPHPRCGFGRIVEFGIDTEIPMKLANSYDRFNIDFRHHCVINHNSGPGIQAVIAGSPVIVDQTSLAHPMSNSFENLEALNLPDREKWFQEILHTEWTVEEIGQGVPQERLLKELTF